MVRSVIHRTLVVGSFQCNCRIMVCPRTGNAVVIDPGDEPEKIAAEIDAIAAELKKPVTVQALLHTHGHLDHINATSPLKKLYPASKAQAHRGDAELFANLAIQGRMFGLPVTEAPQLDHFLEDEEAVSAGDLKLTCIHTPGHSPGGLCFLLNDQLYSGDTLFAGSVGRTDLWGGDQDLMFKSIKDRLLVLDDDIQVHPGHGPSSTIGVEKRTNPFL